jgi:IclR family transcriptional regulator, KDG regulon repressor
MQKRLIQSVRRAASILDLFIKSSGPLGIMDFAKRLELPKTTIAGLVATLEAVGYLEKEPTSGKYRLGPELFQLGVNYAANIDVVTIGRPWIERLSFQFMEQVNVGMMIGDRITVMMRKQPEDQYMVFPQVGSVLPFHSTCIGKALFAYMDAARREALLTDYNFESFTSNTISSKEAFLAELEKVRSTGLSFDNQESINGHGGIGGPIFNHKGVAIAAFAISGNPANIEKRREDMIEAVKLTSQQVSAQLGYKGSIARIRDDLLIGAN